MNSWKKAVASLATMPVMLAGLTLLPATAQAADGDLSDDHLVASYDFEDENDKGKDGSGHDNDLTLHGNPEYGKPGDFSSKVVQLRGGNDQYLELPKGLLNDTDSFTVQFDSKSRMTDNDNFFSFAIGNDNQRYFFSRLRPSGVYTAITKGSNGAEQGMNVNANTSNTWHTYRLSVGPEFMAIFVDGVLQAMNTDITTKLSDLGTDLPINFGKSTWNGDKYYNGGVDNISVWNTSYISDDMIWNGISLPGLVESDLALPKNDALGNDITWSSSDPSVLGNDGSVTKNPSQETKITLTGSVMVNDSMHSKAFTVVVAAAIATADQAAERLLIDYQLVSGSSLPTTIPGVRDAIVSWKSSDPSLVNDDGTIIGADGGNAKDVDLTATVTLNGSATKLFKDMRVMPKSAQTLAAYTRNASVDGGNRVGGSLHLALSADGKTYSALNQNYGVAFAEAEYITSESDKTTSYQIRDMADPYLFRMEDGKYAYVAVGTDEKGNRVDPGTILFSTSSDLVQWSSKPNDDVIDQQRMLNDDGVEFDPGSLTAGWDASAQQYRLGWSVNGAGRYVTTLDFNTFSEVKNGVAFAKRTVDDLNIEKSIPSNTMSIDTDTAKTISDKLGRVSNTKVSDPTDIEVKTGASKTELKQAINGGTRLENGNLSKGSTATAAYSDSSTHDFRVNWNESNLESIDTSRPGTYKVNGTINQQNFSDGAMMQWRADPNVVFWQGKYYFIATNEGADKNIYIRSSDTMDGLKDVSTPISDGAGGHYVPGQDTFLWGDKDDTGHDGYHWAPELHAITDSEGKQRLFCFYAQMPKADNDGTGIPYAGPNWAGPAAYVMELKEGGDPLNTADWAEHRVVKSDDSHLSDTGLTIDMTYFEVGGKSYLAWSQGDELYKGALANVSIAETTPDEPWKIISDPVRIARCEYGWELGGVNEGPNVLVNDGKVYMVFSAQYVSPQYATGMLIADTGSDLTKASSWTKSNYPWMHNGVFPGQSGLGHNSYFTDPYGDVYNVYHFGGSGNRNASIVPVHFRTDGSPILDMKVSEELDQSKKNVVLNVIVQDDPVPSSDASLKSLEVAGSSIDLGAAATQAGAELQVDNPSSVSASDIVTVVNDENARANISVAHQVVTVRVTAQDGMTTKIYTVNLVKRDSAQPDHGALEITGDDIVDGKLSIRVGTTRNLTAVLTAAEGEKNTNIEWRSSDPSVAAFDKNTTKTILTDTQILTALKKGKATITARVGDLSASIDVVVFADSAAGQKPPKDDVEPTDVPKQRKELSRTGISITGIGMLCLLLAGSSLFLRRRRA